MIKVKLQYRLGNQMFQYAYAYAASKRIGTEFTLDVSSHGNFLKQYFKLRGWYDQVVRWTRKPLIKQTLSQTGHDIPADAITQESDCTYYKGYYQSQDYFAGYETEIRALFLLKNKFKISFQRRYHQVFNNYKTLVIHVRRTDYLQHGNDHTGGTDISLPLSYYYACLNCEDYTDYKKFVIGDDMEFMQAHFGHLNNVSIESNEEIIDFQLLMHADVVICANSSFSWWGAWLNAKPDKVVYAPKYWFGFKTQIEYPNNVVPEDWVQIEAPLEETIK